MKIETKYNVGDTVYPIMNTRFNHSNAVCPECCGYGLLDVYSNMNPSGWKEKCKTCDGSKRVWGHYYKWVVNASSVIGLIDIKITKDGISIVYKLIDKNIIGYVESNLFLSKEDAELECEKRNKEK